MHDNSDLPTLTGPSTGAVSRRHATHRRDLGRRLRTGVGIALLIAVAPACATTPPAQTTTQRLPVVSCRPAQSTGEAPSTSRCRVRIVVVDVPIR